ncbi:hypothetical protein [Curtobacterium sp. MCSS17_008]|uniref:hypothetical protein n=1 Tax=Curtobacterium sp. MCSS17_008 TaxID=2175647 RepID=UPI0011B4AA96|nr:hypothetical protein [Curtobacterium sp. MCSS17_008]
MTMEAGRERGDDVDDTVIRARPDTDAEDDDRAAPAADDTVVRPPAAVPDDDDPLGDTVLRPRSARLLPGDPLVDTVIRTGAEDRAAGGGPVDDTVVRPHPRPGAAYSGASDGGIGTARPTAGANGPGGGAAGLPAGPETRARVPSIRIGGRVVRLDRPVLVGRRPALPRVVRGAEPRLLTVPSPSGEVSSSHLLVHAEGEAAVVDDLRSTNGTVVRPPGAAPFRMAAGASIVVLTGTVVEIGDGNVIEFLSPHLRAGPDDGLPPFPSVP